MTMSAPVLVTAGPIFCVTLRVADRPRAIDRVIDYFGDPPRTRRSHRIDPSWAREMSSWNAAGDVTPPADAGQPPATPARTLQVVHGGRYYTNASRGSSPAT